MASRNIQGGSDELQAIDRRLATSKKVVSITSRNLMAAEEELKNAEFLVMTLEAKLNAAKQKLDVAREAVKTASREHEDARADIRDAKTCVEIAQKKWEVVDLANDDDNGAWSDTARSTKRKLNRDTNLDMQGSSKRNKLDVTTSAKIKMEEVDAPKATDVTTGAGAKIKTEKVDNHKATAVAKGAMVETDEVDAPQAIRLHGCGIGEVNGVYSKSSLFHIAPMYHKKCEYKGKEETFAVRLTSRDAWYIGVLDIQTYCVKHPMYVVTSRSDSPPKSGWKCFDCTSGIDPPPTIRYISKMKKKPKKHSRMKRILPRRRDM